MFNDIKQFKIRCSAIGKLMSGKIGITDIQKQYIVDMEAREKAMTTKQKEKYDDLVFKLKNPTLPQGAKTYVKDWFKGQLYQRRKNISTYCMAKGDIMEEAAINFLVENDYVDFAIKNEKKYSSDYVQGEPDLVQPDEIIDIKNSFSSHTFPLFESTLNLDYYWQVQGYMSLTGKQNARVIYCLMNTPDYMIQSEARRKAYTLNELERYDEYYEQLRAEMTYDDVPTELRVKIYNVERNDTEIEEIKQRVKLARKYVDELIKNVQGKLIIKQAA